MATRAILPVALTAFLFTVAVYADDAAKSAASTRPTEDAVLVGQITEMGLRDNMPPGRNEYHGVKVKVLRVLQGSADAEVTVTLYANLMITHQLPKAGGTYLFFVRKNTEKEWKQPLGLGKLPATDDQVWASYDLTSD